jgi:hypothetical protein
MERLKIAFQKSTLKKGFIVSVVVGSVLNLINQGNLILGNHFPEVSLSKLCLTYIAPFLVSVYSTSSSIIQQKFAHK